MNESVRTLIKAHEVARLEEYDVRHPLNPASGARLRTLSGAAGLERVGFHLVRLPPGREANEIHTHRYEEEFFYVLEGRGVATIDGIDHEVGVGDFMGFATPSVAHGLRNPFDADLVYLVGGERREFEVAEFPRLGKIMLREKLRATILDRGAGQTIEF